MEINNIPVTNKHLWIKYTGLLADELDFHLFSENAYEYYFLCSDTFDNETEINHARHFNSNIEGISIKTKEI